MKRIPANSAVSGFTLIEMMITVAVIGILAAIAYPSYTAYVVRGNRVDMQRQLVQHAQQLERFHSVNGTYLNGANCGVANPVSPRYALQTVCQADSFTITATPNAGGVQAADGDLTLTQEGVRGGSVQNGRWSD